MIAGKKELIDKIKNNPFARVVRCDKNTIAALTAVLTIYLKPEKVLEQIPALRMLALQEEELELKAQELKEQINSVLGSRCQMEIQDVFDEVGGGSLPELQLKGKAIALTIEGLSANRLQELLRKGSTPIICRIVKDKVLLNVRTISKEEFPFLTQTLLNIMR